MKNNTGILTFVTMNTTIKVHLYKFNKIYHFVNGIILKKCKLGKMKGQLIRLFEKKSMAYVEKKLREGVSLISTFFPEFSSEVIESFYKVALEYFFWNSKVNLISRKDILNIVEHHILHSLSIFKFVKFIENSIIVDIGSGGGFPAVPLALANPNLKIFAVESIRKKVKAIEDICLKMSIKNVIPIHGRFENKKEIKGHYFTGRAVAPIPTLLNWIRNRFIKEKISNNYTPQSLIYLKGRDIEKDISFLERNGIPYFVFEIYSAIPLLYYKDKIILVITPLT